MNHGTVWVGRRFNAHPVPGTPPTSPEPRPAGAGNRRRTGWHQRELCKAAPAAVPRPQPVTPEFTVRKTPEEKENSLHGAQLNPWAIHTQHPPGPGGRSSLPRAAPAPCPRRPPGPFPGPSRAFPGRARRGGPGAGLGGRANGGRRGRGGAGSAVACGGAVGLRRSFPLIPALGSSLPFPARGAAPAPAG